MKFIEKIKSNQRGDTLIEVLLATVVISIVIASAYSLTTRAARANQTALERTTVNNLMREQMEVIRGAHNTNRGGSFWQNIESRVTSATIPSTARTDCTPVDAANAFYVDTSTSIDYNLDSSIQSYSSPSTFHPLYDVWVEIYQPPLVASFVDVYVRACWDGIGGQGIQTSGLVLRLVL